MFLLIYCNCNVTTNELIKKSFKSMIKKKKVKMSTWFITIAKHISDFSGCSEQQLQCCAVSSGPLELFVLFRFIFKKKNIKSTSQPMKTQQRPVSKHTKYKRAWSRLPSPADSSCASRLILVVVIASVHKSPEKYKGFIHKEFPCNKILF